MSARILILGASLLALKPSYGQSTNYEREYDLACTAWEGVVYGGQKNVTVKQATDAVQKAWGNLSEKERGWKAYYHARDAIIAAGMLVDDGDTMGAAELMTIVGNVASKYPVVVSRGKSPMAFHQIAKAHAAVWAATKRDPLAGRPVGYEMEQEGGFIALQEILDGESILLKRTTDKVRVDEVPGGLLLFNSAGRLKSAVLVALRKDADDGASLRSRLAGILIEHAASEAGPSGYNRLDDPVQYIKNELADDSPEAVTTQPAAISSTTRTPLAAPLNSPTAPTDEPVSFDRRPVWAVLIVAATCLLWMLLKKRKS